MKPLITVLRQRFPQCSRDELLSWVMCGEIRVDGERVRDPKHKVGKNAQIHVQRSTRQYVSRGGIKLTHALATWELPVDGKVFVDAGSSTGGFTDCLLRHGAAAVHAVDVGYNQLDFRLRSDPRVVVHERTNIMRVGHLTPPAQAAVADLSFRSLSGAARHLLSLTTEGWAVVLIKPQFEWREPAAEFEGVVPFEYVVGIIDDVARRLWEDGAFVERVLESPVTGTGGNREFLALVRSSPWRPLDEVLEAYRGLS